MYPFTKESRMARLRETLDARKRASELTAQNAIKDGKIQEVRSTLREWNDFVHVKPIGGVKTSNWEIHWSKNRKGFFLYGPVVSFYVTLGMGQNGVIYNESWRPNILYNVIESILKSPKFQGAKEVTGYYDV